MALDPQVDLPDFNTSRQVTDDPIIQINQAVNVTPYNSGILDVGVFTQLLMSAVTQTANAVFSVTLTFYADAAGTVVAFSFANFIENPGTRFNKVYPTSTRYVRVQASELTATGGTISLAVVPSSGPSNEFILPVSSNVFAETSVAAGASTIFSLNIAARGLWRFYFFTRSPQWELDIQVADVVGIFENRFVFTHRTVSPPLTLDLRMEVAYTQLKVTNNWAFTARFIAWFTQVGH